MIVAVIPKANRHASPKAALLFVLLLSTAGAWAQPYVATQAAGPVSRTNATVNGMVTPRGLSTTCWFEWGTNSSYGQVTGPMNAGSGSNVVRVSAALDSLLTNSVYRFRLVASNSAGTTYGMEQRLTTGRRIAAWGYVPWGGITGHLVLPPQDLGEVVGMAAGDYHGLAIKPDGTVATWGSYWVPGRPFNPPTDLSNVVAVAGGRDHNLAVRSDGRAVAWGDHSSGQTNIPVNLTNVIAVTAGDEHSLALKADGNLVIWGRFEGVPVTLPSGLSNVVAISSGDDYCLALKNNGTVIGWGRNQYGQATAPAGLSNVVSVAAGFAHSVVLKSNGTVFAWGYDAVVNVPAGLSNVVQIASGDLHCVVLRSDETVAAWPNGYYAVDNPPAGLAGVVNLACGDEYSMALAANCPPMVSAQTLSGPVNSDSVLSPGQVTLSNYDPNNDPLTWRIGSLPSYGALYQLATGGRGDLISTNDTPITDSSGRVVFAPAPDEFGAPYTSFTFIANDGELDSPPAAATVNIVPSPAAEISVALTNSISMATVRFAGLSNAAYTVWASTNLQNWSQLGTASQPSPEQFIFTDTSTTNFPRRFYRIRSP